MSSALPVSSVHWSVHFGRSPALHMRAEILRSVIFCRSYKTGNYIRSTQIDNSHLSSGRPDM